VNVVDGAPELLRASEDTSTTEAVAGSQRAWRERIGRRWLVALAGATVVVLVAGTVLLTEPRERGSQAEAPPAPTIPTPAPTAPTTVPSNVVTPPITMPGDGSKEDPLLPEGAPSTPEIGELVASAASMDGRAYSVYADGRLIAPVSSLPRTAFVEQRLTAEGVERVRSEFLGTGLFDPGQPAIAVHSASQVMFCVCVRDGGRLLARSAAHDVQVQDAAARLLTYIESLASSRPTTAWADQEPKPYVASRIAVCLSMYVRQVQEPTDLTRLLPLFPTRAAELLGGREPLIRPGEQDASCFEMTLEEARALAGEFLAPSGGGLHEYWGIVIRINGAFDAMQPGADEGNAAYVSFQTLLPDGA
jgi:hypothetical protein